jgi:hypothetical protein
MSSSVVFWFSWFWRGLLSMPEFIGNNKTGFIFAIIVGLFYEWRQISGVPQYAAAGTRAAKWQVVWGYAMQHWANTLKPWVVIFCAFLVVHTLDLVSRNTQTLSSQNGNLRDQITTNDAACIREKNDLRLDSVKSSTRAETLEAQNRDQQNTINNCQTEAIKRITPDPEVISPRDLSDLKNSKRQKLILLQTNIKVGKPATIVVSCDAPIKDVNGGPINTSMTFLSPPYQTGPTSWELVVLGPPEWVQGYPLLIQYDYDGTKEPKCGFGRK